MKLKWNDDARIEVRCSVCAERFYARVGDLRAGTTVTHQKCGTKFDTMDAARELRPR